MTSKRRITIIAAVAVLLLSVSWPWASQEIAKQTDLRCTACHDKPGSKLLTDQGKYWESMRTLEGYDQIKESFGKCTTCHVRKPGSPKLTKKSSFNFMPPRLVSQSICTMYEPCLPMSG